MRAKKAVLGGLIVVMLLTLGACGGGGNDNVLGSKKNADLVLSENAPRFDPTTLKIALNKEVVLTVFNDGKELHNVTIPGMEIDVDIQPKTSATIKLPVIKDAPRDGFFTIYCKYHQAEGEAGRIEISR